MTEVGSTQQHIDDLPFLDSSGVLDDIIAICREQGWADDENQAVGTPPVDEKAK